MICFVPLSPLLLYFISKFDKIGIFYLLSYSIIYIIMIAKILWQYWIIWKGLSLQYRGLLWKQAFTISSFGRHWGFSLSPPKCGIIFSHFSWLFHFLFLAKKNKQTNWPKIPEMRLKALRVRRRGGFPRLPRFALASTSLSFFNDRRKIWENYRVLWTV